MPTKPRVEPDLTMQRACRLLEAIRAAVPVTGVNARTLEIITYVCGYAAEYGYTAAEYRAAIKALRECGALQYKRGVYTRGEMF